MDKKTHHHSVHFSSELQKLADTNMHTGGFPSLNAYVEALIRGHDAFLRTCQACHDREVAESVRAVLTSAQKAGPVPWRE